ncbi:MAG TPA: protein-methionine-sulfoxide reductase heme-binding subunit MsrQ [Rhabdaerophilum sp.]|nr:protein-methionine-sulfoxide reductase heme-binding subunit MsrQ [Rhabdaerophilum sp.]
MPWFDRQGRFSLLKFVVFVGVIAPGLWIGWSLNAGLLGPKPINAALHEIGLWSVRFLLVTLAITPLRLITGQNRLILVRRTLGVASFAYAAIHLVFYIVDLKFDLVKVTSEIVLRFYLLIGFVSLTVLLVLAATSTDGMIRRLGAARWNLLHSAVYPVALLALWHGALQSKIDASEHVVMTGLFLVLMAIRAMRGRVALNVLSLFLLAVLGAAATLVVEMLWYGLATGVPAQRIFEANWMLALQPRPALVVGMITMSLPVLSLAFGGASRAVAGRRALQTS